MNRNLIVVFSLLVLSACNHSNSKPVEGKSTSGTDNHYYSSGKLKDSTFIIGSTDQRYLEFYEDGKVKQVGYYSNGLKGGTWRELNEAGEVTSAKYYENDTLFPNCKIDPNDFSF